MELVLFTIIFTVSAALVFIGTGYIVGTITVEDEKADIPDSELADKIRQIKGADLSKDDRIYLEEAAQRLEHPKEDTNA